MKPRKETEAQKLRRYKQNAEEAEAFCPNQFSIPELRVERNLTRNSLLRKKIDHFIESYQAIEEKSKVQNAENLAKMNLRMTDAINGLPLRRVKSILKKMVKKNRRNLELKAAYLLLEAEFANLCAKNPVTKRLRGIIYQRKEKLLETLEPILSELGWRHGIEVASGKHAKYIIFCYLPTGEQVSWHCNEYELCMAYPPIDVVWDGQPCTTLSKILDYIKIKFLSTIVTPIANKSLVA